MPRSTLTWMEIATAQKKKSLGAKEVKDLLAVAKVNDIVAARDRESFSEPWRRVLLKKVSTTSWLLLDDKGKVLDEPDCPCGGFTEASLLEEAGMDYYAFPFDQIDGDAFNADDDDVDDEALFAAADDAVAATAAATSAFKPAKAAAPPGGGAGAAGAGAEHGAGGAGADGAADGAADGTAPKENADTAALAAVIAAAAGGGAEEFAKDAGRSGRTDRRTSRKMAPPAKTRLWEIRGMASRGPPLLPPHLGAKRRSHGRSRTASTVILAHLRAVSRAASMAASS